MKTVNFTEFRKHASGFFSEVEEGETLIVLRHGRVVAEISPPKREESRMAAWKKPGLKISMNGLSLSKAILEEREVS